MARSSWPCSARPPTSRSSSVGAPAAAHPLTRAVAESFKFVRTYPLTQADVVTHGGETEGRFAPAMDYTPPAFITLLFTDIGTAAVCRCIVLSPARRAHPLRRLGRAHQTLPVAFRRILATPLINFKKCCAWRSCCCPRWPQVRARHDCFLHTHARFMLAVFAVAQTGLPWRNCIFRPPTRRSVQTERLQRPLRLLRHRCGLCWSGAHRCPVWHPRGDHRAVCGRSGWRPASHPAASCAATRSLPSPTSPSTRSSACSSCLLPGFEPSLGCA